MPKVAANMTKLPDGFEQDLEDMFSDMPLLPAFICPRCDLRPRVMMNTPWGGWRLSEFCVDCLTDMFDDFINEEVK